MSEEEPPPRIASETPDSDAAATAFGKLADETRIDILWELWESHAGLAFSELRERVGVEDSGKFGYHLEKLTGTFVAKVDGEYRLDTPGMLVADVLVQGSLTDDPEGWTEPLDADCPTCGAGLVAEYRERSFFLPCTECDTVVNKSPFPPQAVAARDREGALAAYSERIRRQFALAGRGVCPYCCGRMETEIRVDPHWHLHLPAVTRCTDCGGQIGSTIALQLLDHPAIMAFLEARDVPVEERPFWEFDFCIGDENAELLSEDPFRVAVSIDRDGDELRLTVDESADVVKYALIERN